MINTELFFNNLIAKDISFFSGVPDSLLKNICAYASDNLNEKNHIIAANEGNALAIGIGYHLASGKLPLIYMQNSGLGNCVNPLLSLADPKVYSIPLLLMIGWRGEPGINDEPQHKKQGEVTLKLLDDMDIPYQILSPDTSNEEAHSISNDIIHDSLKYNKPHGIIVKKNSFSDYKIRNNNDTTYLLSREDAIKTIVNSLEGKEIIVSTTGVASRELFENREDLKQGHNKDFLTVGGMGHANQIALGIAIHKPNKQIICIDGDGAVLMHMGSLAINGSLKCNNFKHIVINNGVHDSVGGQPTVGLKTNFASIAKNCGYQLVLQAQTNNEIIKCMHDLKRFNGTVFFEVKVKKGFRKNLGRPTTTPIQNKKDLMKFIEDE